MSRCRHFLKNKRQTSLSNAISCATINFYMNKITLHVINHTHWDREWFVPFTFTRKWIPRLIKDLEKVIIKDPKYTFLFDAQTMVIEDLKEEDSHTYNIAKKIIKNKQMEIGPYYAQIDMRLSNPESFIRNLRTGIDIAKSLDASEKFTAWDVDIFGQVSQSPQIHNMFGIDNAYIWRGVPKLEPFFWWKGENKSKLFVTDLFAGGYRNFYKVTSIDNLALPRLKHEIKKLSPFYKDGQIPVFDGYDLDNQPGNAAEYFYQHHQDYLKKKNIDIVHSTPYDFAQTISSINSSFPTLTGELISGKYASIFPGTLSTRIYSKLSSNFAEQMLYRYAEPLSAFLPTHMYPHDTFLKEGKMILQNLVHDVICGCSIDQVHEIAELRSRNTADVMQKSIQKSLNLISRSLQNGTYAYLPTTGLYDTYAPEQNKLYQIKGRGVGIKKVEEIKSLEKSNQTVNEFIWKNSHYNATFTKEGFLTYNKGSFGRLVARLEEGDTYWDEPRGDVENLTINTPLNIDYQTDTFAQISFDASIKTGRYNITAHITVTFDDSALICWKITHKSTGTGFSLLFRNEYTQDIKSLQVGMPFDVIERNFEDTNLLSKTLPDDLVSLLIGQRDAIQTFTFPFHSFISPKNLKKNIHILAKGLKAYQTEKNRFIDLVLIRSVDWLMKTSEYKYHTGDAGPKFYVPDARCQRETTIECALLLSDATPEDKKFFQIIDSYLYTPLIFTVNNSHGDLTQIILYEEDTPITSLHQYNNSRLVRAYNPTNQQIKLSKSYETTNPFGDIIDTTDILAPKSIMTLKVHNIVPTNNSKTLTERLIGSILKPQARFINYPQFPTGTDISLPEKSSMSVLSERYKTLKTKKKELQKKIKTYKDNAPYTLVHEYYVVAREAMEAYISYLWNKKRAKRGKKITKHYAFKINKKMYKLTKEYNDLRIMRRMYDYIVDIAKEENE